MNDFFEHIGSDLREIGKRIKARWNKLWGKQTVDGASVITTRVNTNYEINLVPQVKLEMIRAQKTRNLVLFICILVSSVAVGAVVVLFGIKSGQDIAMASQDARLENMSVKLNTYNELGSLVTIQNQLDSIDQISDQKTVLSRVFGALGAMLPQGADSVQLSALNVNLETNVLRLEGQADARTDPLIDYRVLESFKKGAALTKYDYGNYVDADGSKIPTYCIKEADDEGTPYRTGDSYYAWWDLTIEGCEGSQRGGYSVEGAKYYYSLSAETETEAENQTEKVCDENGENCVEQPVANPGADQPNTVRPVRVKVWRTPQYTNWYDAGRMSLSGEITNVEHFESECYTYRGNVVTSASGASTVRWTSNNECMLAPDGLTISESTNGRDSSDNLVLKFTGVVTVAEDFFAFKNKHMMAIGPMGQNVTDSFIQIGTMFTQEATECAPDDKECLENVNNQGGSQDGQQ